MTQVSDSLANKGQCRFYLQVRVGVNGIGRSSLRVSMKEHVAGIDAGINQVNSTAEMFGFGVSKSPVAAMDATIAGRDAHMCVNDRTANSREKFFGQNSSSIQYDQVRLGSCYQGDRPLTVSGIHGMQDGLGISGERRAEAVPEFADSLPIKQDCELVCENEQKLPASLPEANPFDSAFQ